jgi:hypothetical protein
VFARPLDTEYYASGEKPGIKARKDPCNDGLFAPIKVFIIIVTGTYQPNEAVFAAKIDHVVETELSRARQDHADCAADAT